MHFFLLGFGLSPSQCFRALYTLGRLVFCINCRYFLPICDLSFDFTYSFSFCHKDVSLKKLF